MKKLICLALVLVMALGLSASLAENEYQQITPSLINSLDLTAEDWMATDYIRAMLTILFALDLDDELGVDVSDFLVNGFSFVGRDNITVIVTFYDGTYLHSVFYVPALDFGTYGSLYAPGLTSSDLESTLAGYCPDGLYENTVSALSDALDMLSSLVE